MLVENVENLLVAETPFAFRRFPVRVIRVIQGAFRHLCVSEALTDLASDIAKRAGHVRPETVRTRALHSASLTYKHLHVFRAKIR